MKFTMRMLPWLAAGAGLAMMAVAAALAQTAPPAAIAAVPGAPSPVFSMKGDRRVLRLFCENRDALLAGGLAFLHTKLDIAASQEQAWQRFGDDAQRSIAQLGALCAGLRSDPPPATALDRLAVEEHLAAAHLQILQSIRPALAELYDALAPEQRRRLDSLPFPGPLSPGRQ